MERGDPGVDQEAERTRENETRGWTVVSGGRNRHGRFRINYFE